MEKYNGADGNVPLVVNNIRLNIRLAAEVVLLQVDSIAFTSKKKLDSSSFFQNGA